MATPPTRMPPLPLLLLLVSALVCPGHATAALSAPSASSTLVASSAADLRLSGGAAFAANPLSSLRSGEPHQHSAATFAVPLTPGAVLTGVAFEYCYTTGFGPTGNGSNFSLVAAGATLYRSPPLTKFSYSKSHPNYSAPVTVRVNQLNLRVTNADDRVSLVFDNNDRNLQLLLPLNITLSCTSGPCATYPLLPAFIDSNMVLQRAPAQPTIWGHNAAVGETVSVQLDQGGLWSTTADSAGHWLVRMAPQEASTGHTLTLNFSSTSRQRVLQNIAFGDVCVRLRS